MKRFAFSAAIAALFATAAVADNNDIYINQIGSGNAVGDALHPASQAGQSNVMDFTQGGNDNQIGVIAASPAALQGAEQSGNQNEMTVSQPGNRNVATYLNQDGGDKNIMSVTQSGNDNMLAVLRQNGDQNDATVVQRGNRNDGLARQVGFKNVLTVLQSGNENDFDILSGDFGVLGRPDACAKCVVTLTQSGSNNYASVWQQDNNQLASIVQSGNGNYAYTKQQAH